MNHEAHIQKSRKSFSIIWLRVEKKERWKGLTDDRESDGDGKKEKRLIKERKWRDKARDRKIYQYLLCSSP